jgi:hypothetical protein
VRKVPAAIGNGKKKRVALLFNIPVKA